jgi:hypothetical protein
MINSQTPIATFRGWQETGKGDFIALYNIEGGRLHKSTVTARTLKKEGIAVPKIQPNWKGVK